MLLSFNSYRIYFGTAPLLTPILTTFAMTFFAYRLSAHRPLIVSRFPFFTFEARLPLAELVLTSAMMIGLFLLAGTHIRRMLPFTALLTVLYFLRWRIGKKELPGLRGIPGLKNLVLATAWALITVGFTTGLHPDDQLWRLLFFHRLLLILLLGIGVDLRDLRNDRRSGIVTLPILYGFPFVRTTTFILGAAISFYYFRNGVLTTAPLFLPFLLLSVSVALLRPNDRPFRFTLLLDGILVVTGLVEVFF